MHEFRLFDCSAADECLEAALVEIPRRRMDFPPEPARASPIETDEIHAWRRIKVVLASRSVYRLAPDPTCRRSTAGERRSSMTEFSVRGVFGAALDTRLFGFLAGKSSLWTRGLLRRRDPPSPFVSCLAGVLISWLPGRLRVGRDGTVKLSLMARCRSKPHRGGSRNHWVHRL